MRLPVVDVEVERPRAVQQAAHLAQARLEEAEVVVERVAVGRLGQQLRRVTPAAEAVAVAVLILADLDRLPRLELAGVERRIEVGELERLVLEAGQDVEVVAEENRVVGRRLHPAEASGRAGYSSVGSCAGRSPSSTSTSTAMPSRMTVKIDLLARKPRAHEAYDLLGVLDLLAVDSHDQVAAERDGDAVELALLVAGAQAGRLRRAVAENGLDHRAVVGAQVELVRQRRRDRLRRDPDPGVAHLPVGLQLVHRADRGVDRHREADALGRPRRRADLGVDPDHRAGRIEQRAAGVARVDGRVGLDRVDERVLRCERVDRALGRRDDADAQRALAPERAADRRNGLADDDLAGIPERKRRELVRGRVDLQESDVVEEIPADHLGLDAVAVLELHVDALGRLHRLAGRRLADGRDHVRVGEDVALGRRDEAGSLRLACRSRAGAAEVGEDRDDAVGALAIDRGRVESVAGERAGSCPRRPRAARPSCGRRSSRPARRMRPSPSRRQAPRSRRRRRRPRRERRWRTVSWATKGSYRRYGARGPTGLRPLRTPSRARSRFPVETRCRQKRASA